MRSTRGFVRCAYVLCTYVSTRLQGIARSVETESAVGDGMQCIGKLCGVNDRP